MNLILVQGNLYPLEGKVSEKTAPLFFCPKNSLKFKLLAFWSKVDKTCTYEKVPKNLGRTLLHPPLLWTKSKRRAASSQETFSNNLKWLGSYDKSFSINSQMFCFLEEWTDHRSERQVNHHLWCPLCPYNHLQHHNNIATLSPNLCPASFEADWKLLSNHNQAIIKQYQTCNKVDCPYYQFHRLQMKSYHPLYDK